MGLVFLIVFGALSVGCGVFFLTVFLTRRKHRKPTTEAATSNTATSKLKVTNSAKNAVGGHTIAIASAIVIDETSKEFDPDGELVPIAQIPKASFVKDWGTNTVHLLGRNLAGKLWVIVPPCPEPGRLPTDAYLLSRSKGPVKELFSFTSPVAKAIAMAFFITAIVGSLILIFMLVASRASNVPA